MQHVHRGGRTRRHGRPRRDHLEYIKGRQHAPKGEEWDNAVEYWKSLPTDEGAVFDKEIFINADELEPFVTWGTNPGQGIPLSHAVPSPDDFEDENDKVAAERALEYMDLKAGTPMKEIPVDVVFLGSAPTPALRTCAPPQTSCVAAPSPRTYA